MVSLNWSTYADAGHTKVIGWSLASTQGSKWAGERPVYIHKPAD